MKTPGLNWFCTHRFESRSSSEASWIKELVCSGSMQDNLVFLWICKRRMENGPEQLRWLSMSSPVLWLPLKQLLALLALPPNHLFKCGTEPFLWFSFFFVCLFFLSPSYKNLQAYSVTAKEAPKWLFLCLSNLAISFSWCFLHIRNGCEPLIFMHWVGGVSFLALSYILPDTSLFFLFASLYGSQLRALTGCILWTFSQFYRNCCSKKKTTAALSIQGTGFQWSCFVLCAIPFDCFWTCNSCAACCSGRISQWVVVMSSGLITCETEFAYTLFNHGNCLSCAILLPVFWSHQVLLQFCRIGLIFTCLK